MPEPLSPHSRDHALQPESSPHLPQLEKAQATETQHSPKINFLNKGSLEGLYKKKKEANVTILLIGLTPCYIYSIAHEIKVQVL